MHVVVIHGISDDPEIVGPFETFEEADAWGKATLDPRDATFYVQRVITPDTAQGLFHCRRFCAVSYSRYEMPPTTRRTPTKTAGPSRSKRRHIRSPGSRFIASGTHARLGSSAL